MSKNGLTKRIMFIVLNMIIVCILSMTVFAKEDDEIYVAKVGNDYYTDLESAVNAFNGYGGTLTLLADCSKTLETREHWITVTSGGVFDLNGYELRATGGSSVINIKTGNMNFTLKDSSEQGTGRISGSSYSIWHDGSWDVFIQSGTYQNFIRIGNGSLIINGGTFENNAFGNVKDDEAKIVLNGGTFEMGIWFPGFDNQTVYEILGEGKTYEVDGIIKPRSSIQDLGDVYEFEKYKCVKIVNETDAVASFTYYTSPNSKTPNVDLCSSLSVAFEREKNGAYYDAYITLLKDTNENITVDSDVSLIFEAKADGVFTFVDNGDSIYLEKNLPEGMILKVKHNTYELKESVLNSIIFNQGEGVSTSVDQIQPVDGGVAARKIGAGICLVHVHEWVYNKTTEEGKETITAYCKYPQSCVLDSDEFAVSVTMNDVSFVYDYTQNRVPRPLYTMEYVGRYTETIPDKNDVVFYDENGNVLSEAPTQPGNYTARVVFGDQTAKASIIIKKETLDASFFNVILPEHSIYDGTIHSAEVNLATGVIGVGDITIKYNGDDSLPINAGTYQVTIDVSEGTYFEGIENLHSDNWIFTIDKTNQSAPAVSKVDETIANKNDGKIVDVDSSMEYRKAGENVYAGVEGNEIQNLSAGEYFIRFKENDNYYASPETAVIIEAGRMPIIIDTENPEDTPSQIPATGDSSNIWLYWILFIGSIGVIKTIGKVTHIFYKKRDTNITL